MSKPIRQFNKLDEFHRLRSIVTDECVLWPYASDQHGYGKIHYRGRQHVTHRLALVLETGLDDPLLDAAHGPCHEPACMNVRHLRWATRAENQLDRVRDGTDQRGIKSTTAKLTEQQVREIIVAEGTQREIGERYGVGDVQVYRIKNGQRWRHIWNEMHQ